MNKAEVGKNSEFTFEQSIKDAVKFNIEGRIAKPCCEKYFSGYTELDKIINGIHPAELTLVAGRPAMGKTSFVLNLIRHLALRKHMKIGFFSALEEPEKIANMLLSMEAHVDIKHIETGLLTHDERDNVNDAASELYKAEILYNSPLYGSRCFELSDLFFDIVRYVWGEDVDIIIIDALQYIEIKGAGNEQENAIEAVKELRNLAIAAGIPIILISNLPASIDNRENQQPQIEDLRVYGPIDKYIDTILFIYRKEYYNWDVEWRGIMEIEVAKHINGKTGSVLLMYLPQYCSCCNVDENIYDSLMRGYKGGK
jgi:replicative DNA helicase